MAQTWQDCRKLDVGTWHISPHRPAVRDVRFQYDVLPLFTKCRNHANPLSAIATTIEIERITEILTSPCHPAPFRLATAWPRGLQGLWRSSELGILGRYPRFRRRGASATMAGHPYGLTRNRGLFRLGAMLVFMGGGWDRVACVHC
jgi:hypothetical protein